MIIVFSKSIEDIVRMTRPYPRLLLIGCGTCLTVCHAGGEQEVSIIARAIMLARQSLSESCVTRELVIRRQCEPELCEDIVAIAGDYDAILSFGCAAGMQTVSDMLRTIPVLPAIDTQCMGKIENGDHWVEQCVGCGDCTLDQSAGICMLTRCPKSQMNEPCGGESETGRCEVDPNLDCVWVSIAHRQLPEKPTRQLCDCIDPKDWSTSHSGGCRVHRPESDT